MGKCPKAALVWPCSRLTGEHSVPPIDIDMGVSVRLRTDTVTPGDTGSICSGRLFGQAQARLGPITTLVIRSKTKLDP